MTIKCFLRKWEFLKEELVESKEESNDNKTGVK